MPAQPPQQQFQWLTINDFTPGLNTIGGPQNPGVAQSIVDCYPLPQGGLAPFYSKSPITLNFSNQTNIPARIVSFAARGPLPQDELIVGMQAIVNNYDRYFLFSYYAGVTRTIYGPITASQPTTNTYFGSDTVPMRFFQGSLNNSNPLQNTTSPTPFNSSYVTNWRSPADLSISGSSGNIICYPIPDGTGANTGQIDGPNVGGSVYNVSGSVVGYSSRILIFNYIGQPMGLLNANFISNDQVFYTDPIGNANVYNGSASGVVGTTLPYSVFGNDPSGYGAFSLLSPNQLVCVSTNKGAVIIQGDIANASSSFAPAIESTHGTMGIGESTSMGFVYIAGSRNAYMHSGGIVSSPIATQLAPNTFITDPQMVGVQWQISSYGQFVFCSGGYILDTVTNAWFKSSYDFFWSRKSGSGNFYLASNIIPAQSQTVTVYTLNQTRVNTYSWESYPMFVSANTQVIISELDFVLGSAGTVSGQLIGPNTSVTIPPCSINEGGFLRIPIGFTDDYVTLSLSVSGNTPSSEAPIIYSASLRYMQGNLAQSQG
jgi:hypothetical protein